MPPAVKVATWNLFHGQTSPPDQRDHFADFADALAGSQWDACALQEVPQWWPVMLGRRCGASVRVARSSRVRSFTPALQHAVARCSPGRLGSAGAAVNVLLIRPQTGVIAAHRRARLRSFPQRRSVHGVRLCHPESGAWWLANVHCHNRPEPAATADTARALEIVRGWAGDEPVVLAGDLNVGADLAASLASHSGFQVLSGHRVDHVLGRGFARAAPATAQRIEADQGRTLSDHRMVIVGIITTP